jgi:hypothetical protein
VGVDSASGAASECATNELGHAVIWWMITLAHFDRSARVLGDPSVAFRVATAFLGSEQASGNDLRAANEEGPAKPDGVPNDHGEQFGGCPRRVPSNMGNGLNRR